MRAPQRPQPRRLLMRDAPHPLALGEGWRARVWGLAAMAKRVVPQQDGRRRAGRLFSMLVPDVDIAPDQIAKKVLETHEVSSPTMASGITRVLEGPK